MWTHVYEVSLQSVNHHHKAKSDIYEILYSVWSLLIPGQGMWAQVWPLTFALRWYQNSWVLGLMSQVLISPRSLVLPIHCLLICQNEYLNLGCSADPLFSVSPAFPLVMFSHSPAQGYFLLHAWQVVVHSFFTECLVLTFQYRPINLHLKFELFFLLSHAVIFLF